MNRTIQPAPVRRSVTVNVSQARAFAVFTGDIGRWWPRSHHIGSGEIAAITIEPHVDGRWYETSKDGVDCDWGKVLVWAPPERIVLGWQISAEFAYDPDLLTEVELRFIPEAERVTRVELEHRNLERFGDKAPAVVQSIDGPNGWRRVLELYAEAASE